MGADAPELTPRPSTSSRSLWTVGHKGNDLFGEPTRPGLSRPRPCASSPSLAYGVCFHDNDLIPIGTGPSEREQILADFRKALDETGMKVSMATTNLFADPVSRTAPSPRTIATFAASLPKTDLGAELGAPIYVFWGGREGVEADAAKPARAALERYREAVDFVAST